MGLVKYFFIQEKIEFGGQTQTETRKDLRRRNPEIGKFEARNPKFETSTNVQNLNDPKR